MTFEKVYETLMPPRADIAKALLAAQNIEGVILNKRDGQYLFGKIELHVPAKDATLAKSLIETELSDFNS